MPEKKPEVRGLSKREIRMYRAKVGRWLNKPVDAQRWILVQHGMILHRLGDMILNEEYESLEKFKEDLREFQDWAGICGEMLLKYDRIKDGDEEAGEPEEAPERVRTFGARTHS